MTAMTISAEEKAAQMNAAGSGFLPGYLGIRILTAEPGRVRAELPVLPHLLAPNGYLHAGSVVTLADTACGYGCLHSLPEGAQSFTTIELKSNHTGTAREGCIEVLATARHLGRTTQLWDAEVSYQGKVIALFRCTQMLLYPKPQV
ncbi:PaaI family thioesterase [Undibacterium griseum]|uniref:PaaI family thioesterase n=1 Tax=Undibacterium griseum TaxID=2762295 RepID=A0ABR6YID7_9BURK|nr:PaaI family thioesterase [Undibacterium griseum]MBC3883540.1 PaaI family thioesterase [Undibacterium griseum]